MLFSLMYFADLHVYIFERN